MLHFHNIIVKDEVRFCFVVSQQKCVNVQHLQPALCAACGQHVWQCVNIMTSWKFTMPSFAELVLVNTKWIYKMGMWGSGWTIHKLEVLWWRQHNAIYLARSAQENVLNIDRIMLETGIYLHSKVKLNTQFSHTTCRLHNMYFRNYTINFKNNNIKHKVVTFLCSKSEACTVSD